MTIVCSVVKGTLGSVVLLTYKVVYVHCTLLHTNINQSHGKLPKYCMCNNHTSTRDEIYTLIEQSFTN